MNRYSCGPSWKPEYAAVDEVGNRKRTAASYAEFAKFALSRPLVNFEQQEKEGDGIDDSHLHRSATAQIVVRAVRLAHERFKNLK